MSCACAACWNGESGGEVRLHDIKRKTSSFVLSGAVVGRRPAPRPVPEGPVDEPLLKQIRLQVHSFNPG